MQLCAEVSRLVRAGTFELNLPDFGASPQRRIEDYVHQIVSGIDDRLGVDFRLKVAILLEEMSKSVLGVTDVGIGIRRLCGVRRNLEQPGVLVPACRARELGYIPT